MKTAFKVYLDPDLAEQVIQTHKQFSSAGRDVNRSEVIEELIRGGFKLWRRETEAVNRLEGTLAQLLDHANRTDKILKSILLTLVEGDKDEVKSLLHTIETELHDA